MALRRKTKNNRGRGLLNTLINSLPVELHMPGGYQFCGPGTNLKKRLALGQKGINKLDAACREHDIAYESSNDSAVREKADRVLENRAWENFKSSDTGIAEKAASWAVTTGMKAKGKIGGGCGFNKIVGVARKAIMKSIKTCPTGANMSKIIKTAVGAAKKHAHKNKKTKPPRIIRVPKSGGAIALIPTMSGLSALGMLAGGVSNIVKVISHIVSKNSAPVGLGRGLYLKPYSTTGGGAYKIAGKTVTKTRKKKSHKKKKIVGRKKIKKVVSRKSKKNISKN